MAWRTEKRLWHTVWLWRGVAAYNCGLQRTKDWKGMPFIRETVLYARDILFNLTKMLELKYAYSTGDNTLIAKTKQRLGV
jgi:urate oxidase